VLVVDSKEIRRFATSRATVVTPNWLEALVALEPHTRHDRAAPPTIADAEDIARRLGAVIDATYITVTMSGDGVLLADREGSVQHVPTRPVPHADTIGAGDAFAAGMALALTVGAPGFQAARIGSAAASIVVAKRGTAVADAEELMARLTTGEMSVATSAHALATRLDLDRHAGRTIVFTNGVFDILHAGHVDLLRRAKECGDVLVVGVNSDCSVRRLKGANRPINGEADRVAVIRSVSAVDHVVVFEEDDAAQLIRMLRPHIYVKGGDYVAERLPEAEAVREVGGRIQILPLVEGRSTTGIVNQIRMGCSSHPGVDSG
jgi:D-beta-D-heptose 7-phosphate kinase/D-beta-D-heptose 1-phosphate adenosyltransferase